MLTRAEDAGFEPARACTPTRFPNLQTEVQRSPHVIVYACETISRTPINGDN